MHPHFVEKKQFYFPSTDKLQEEVKDAYEKCHDNTRTIEIHFKDEETSETTLARVHFPHNPDVSTFTFCLLCVYLYIYN